MRKKKIIALGTTIFVTFMFLAGFVGYVIYRDNQKLQKENAADHRKRVLLALSKVMILPENETPDVLLIREKNETLKRIPVLRKAKTGYEIIIYPRYHKKAIIFDPKSNRIVDMLPINNLNGQGSITEFGDLGK